MTVTIDTAWKLKQAGFPQPAPEWGQMWAYDGRRGMVVFVWGEGGDDVELMFEGEDDPTTVDGTQDLAYMPTVGDLLTVLEPYTSLLKRGDGLFSAVSLENLNKDAITHPDNPAELLARYYLENHA